MIITLLLLAAFDRSSLAMDATSTIRIDHKRLSTTLQKRVKTDLNSLSQIQLHAEADSPFPLIFGGTGNEAVVRFLQERVHYVGMDETDDEDKSQNFAVNMSPDWLIYHFEKNFKKNPDAKPKEMHFEDGTVPLTSPRVGFMGIGAAYTGPDTTKMDRLNTWIHEARHSDCPWIPGYGDLVKYEAEKYGQMTQHGRACGYLHMTCPKGHALAGEDACDDLAWGAYAVGHVYSKTIYKTCSNCTEKDRQAALVSANEDFSRLTPQLKDGLRKGTYPKPDMRSLR